MTWWCLHKLVLVCRLAIPPTDWHNLSNSNCWIHTNLCHWTQSSWQESSWAHMTNSHVNHDLIMAEALSKYNISPCLFQLDICLGLLCKIDVVTTAWTGSGKTLTFFLPMLFEKGIMIIISPLITLENQHAKDASKYGYSALPISWDNFLEKEHKVSQQIVLFCQPLAHYIVEYHGREILCPDSWPWTHIGSMILCFVEGQQICFTSGSSYHRWSTCSLWLGPRLSAWVSAALVAV